MSENKADTCTHPELRPADGKCNPAQIEKCHGSTKEHPGESDKK